MDIHRLSEFAYLAETLSFNETARHFYISQSALSKHMAQMEEEIGAKLFVRDSHHVRLTEVGRMFDADAHSITNLYNSALERIETAKDTGRSLLRIGYLRNASRPFIMYFVKVMKRDHPEIRLILRCMEYGELCNAFETQAIDVAFNMDVYHDFDMPTYGIGIYRDRFDAVVSSENPLAAYDEVTAAQLVGQRFLLPDEETYPGMARMVQEMLPEGWDVEHHSTYRDVDTLYLKIVTEDYLGFSSEHNKDEYGDDVHFIRLIDVPCQYDMCGWVLRGKETPQTEACFDALAECRDWLAAKRREEK